MDWAPGQGDKEYTVAHTVHHINIPTRAEDPEQTETQPPRLAAQQWTLYRLLAHARTLAEHSIQPYQDVIYLGRMLQASAKYETEVLEGRTGPSAQTPNDMGRPGARGGNRRTGQDHSVHGAKTPLRLNHWTGQLTPGSYSSDNVLFWFLAKLPQDRGLPRKHARIMGNVQELF